MRATNLPASSAQEDYSLSECEDSMSHDGNFTPRKNYYIKRGSKRAKILHKRSLYRHSLWTVEENAVYAQFLQLNGQLFECDRLQRKAIKLNVLMSKYVGSRSPEQCRSHHQKMMQYHHSIANILEHLGQPVLPPLSPGELAPQSAPVIRLCELSDENQLEEESLWSKLMREGATEGQKSLTTVDW